MRRSGILMFALLFCGCGGLFYNGDELGGTGGTGGDRPACSLTPTGSYANDRFEVVLSYPDTNATIYRTEDGSDPRISPAAIETMSSFTVMFTTTLQVRASNNGKWSDMLTTNVIIADGSATNPYRITAAVHLYNVRDKLNAHFRQGDHVDIGSYEWSPIGTGGARFQGQYDGNGYTIHNLTLTASQGTNGLFGYCENAILRRITLQNAKSTINVAGISCIGLLAGYIAGSGRIEDVVISGTINGSVICNRVGGLVGESTGTVIGDCHTSVPIHASAAALVGGMLGTASGINAVGCTAVGSVTGGNSAGGFAGKLAYATVSDSTASGAVSGISGAAGFVGDAQYAKLSNCHAFGDVTGTTVAGGFASSVSGASTNLVCSARGKVNGSGAHPGGFVGQLGGGMISNCYATGEVSTSASHAGGFIGYYTFGTIGHCYAVGKISGISFPGGFAGEAVSPLAVTACYWDTSTSMQSDAVGAGSWSGIAGLTTAQMKTQGSFVGWTFPAIWTLSGANSYPHFFWQTDNIPQ